MKLQEELYSTLKRFLNFSITNFKASNPISSRISTTDLPTIFGFASKPAKSKNESSKVDSFYHFKK